MLGTYVLSAGYYDAYYLKAQKVRTLIRRDFTEAFKNVDVLLAPTSPTLPFKLGERTDPVTMYQADVLTAPVNLAGLPAISLPEDLLKICQSASSSWARSGPKNAFSLQQLHWKERLDFRYSYLFSLQLEKPAA